MTAKTKRTNEYNDEAIVKEQSNFIRRRTVTRCARVGCRALLAYTLPFISSLASASVGNEMDRPRSSEKTRPEWTVWGTASCFRTSNVDGPEAPRLDYVVSFGNHSWSRLHA